MTEFEIPIRITRYQKLKVQAETLNDAKNQIALQMNHQKINFEFIDIIDVDVPETPKPELLLENVDEVSEV